MLLDSFDTRTPVRCTESGSCGWATETRFCTSTAAISLSRDESKVAVMVLVPSLLLLEVRYLSPSTPLICLSKIFVTPLSTTSALAPL
jgi:hypothetical protein